MIVTCPDCGATYDDADCWTICPHRQFLCGEDAQRKKAALKLIGKLVRFANEPEGPWGRVQFVTWDGMVGIEGGSGEFDPNLFVVSPEGP